MLVSTNRMPFVQFVPGQAIAARKRSATFLQLLAKRFLPELQLLESRPASAGKLPQEIDHHCRQRGASLSRLRRRRMKNGVIDLQGYLLHGSSLRKTLVPGNGESPQADA